jgi:hypothetical protein
MNSRNFLPNTLYVSDLCLHAEFALCTDFSCNLLDLGREYCQLVNHVVYGVYQLEHLSRNRHTGNLLCQITTRDSRLVVVPLASGIIRTTDQ